MTKAQMKQWLFNSLDELQEEFTGYEEHERKRALQARKRGDESDYQFHTTYANSYKNVAYTINKKILELKGE